MNSTLNRLHAHNTNSRKDVAALGQYQSPEFCSVPSTTPSSEKHHNIIKANSRLQTLLIYTVDLSANVVCGCPNTLLLIKAEGRWYRVLQNTSWSVSWHRIYAWNVRRIRNSKTVCSQSELADDISIHLLWRNSLDIHRKHTASHLYVDACVC